jgi:signal transduction histidine kinase
MVQGGVAASIPRMVTDRVANGVASGAGLPSFDRVSFSRQFLAVCTLLLAAGMLVVGTWISHEIEHSAVRRAAAVAAVYVESILASEVQGLLQHPDAPLDDAARQTLDRIFIHGPLARKVVRFKLWSPQGRVLYSSHANQVGQQVPVQGPLAAALGGELQAHMSALSEHEHVDERILWRRLLEVHVPMRVSPQAPVTAVAEFYHATHNIDADIREAQWRSWVLVAMATLAIFTALYLQVRRANDTIGQQRHDLRWQLQQLTVAFAENERMRLRLREAGAATTALNEQFLHRVAADLHDAPAQTLAYALMRIDELVLSSPEQAELGAIRDALAISLKDLRNIASGLGMPGIESLSLEATVRRALRDVERQTGATARAQLAIGDHEAALATRITIYRVLQESLGNSHRHAPGECPLVQVRCTADWVDITVSDEGGGFDPQQARQAGRLGLHFMEERVQLLGGRFELATAPGRGTTIHAALPLQPTAGS